MISFNVYLQTRANQEQKKWLNVTYVAVSEIQTHKKPIMGYYTLSNSSISLAAMKPEFKKDIPSTYDIPSIKIGRLAVDLKFQNKGFGSLLLKNAFLKIVEIAALSGIRGIEVIAKNDTAVSFYKKYGFVQLIETKNLLFLPINSLVQALD